MREEWVGTDLNARENRAKSWHQRTQGVVVSGSSVPRLSVGSSLRKGALTENPASKSLRGPWI